MSDKKQLTQMSQFSIVREMPGEKSALHSTPTPSTSNNAKKQKPSELKFKIEPIGIQPEDDDDLETCPSRTRSSWPHQIVPWWKPADRYEKPPYSYATLIAHAILTSKDGRLTLSDIYKWISEAYPYYKRGQKGWQNSIRHNLSLNKKWFIKVDRRPTQAHPGKGGYWTLQMNMEKVFVDNLCQAGGHSRRHHDMGMYSSLSTQYYRSSGSENDQDSLSQEELSMQTLCPNIHITRPEDYEVKKNKSTVSAPRIRNMFSQEKKNPSPANAPKTDPKNFIIRFNPHDSTTNINKRKRDAPRPPPKAGKRRNPVEPGSSTAEDDDDSAVDVGSCSDSHTSKKRKSTTKAQDSIVDTITASQYNLSYPSMSYNQAHNLTKPSDVIGNLPASGEDMIGFNHNDFWMYDEPEQKPSNMLLTSEYPPLLYDVEAQNILQGLQSTTAPQQTQPQQPANIISHHPDMKTIDLQTFALEKNIHYPNAFAVEEFSNPNSNLFISDLSSYNLDQYVDFSANMMADDTTHLNQPSDVLLEDDATMNTYWPETSPACYMNFDANNANTMPFVKYD